MKRSLWFVAAAAIALCAGSPASAAELSADSQARLIGNVDAYAPHISEVALKIWAAPELGYQETKTTALLQEELRAAGFAVEAGVAGMPTAFVARAGTGDGPVIAILAEMDALPGMSQEAVPDRAPIANQIAGHACGHHLFGTGAVAAAIAIKGWLESTGTKGQIRVYGTPAEEGGGGKVYMVRAGLFRMSMPRCIGIRRTPTTPPRSAISRPPARNSGSTANPPMLLPRPIAAVPRSTPSRP